MAVAHVLGSSIILCVFLQIVPTTVCISESEALLRLKQSFTNSSALDDSWKPGTEPCATDTEWIGIICVNGLVSSLRLKNMGLSGRIDIDSLASLSNLRSVGFVSNSFTGPLPEFNRMVLLKGLYLSRNQFSGEIPSDYFKTMAGLKKVWLSGNMFSGRVPSSLFQRSRLMDLRLDNNSFSGPIPPPQLPSLIFLDVSYNKLEGHIPPELLRFSTEAFKGNPSLCGDRSKPCEYGSDTSKTTMSIVASAVVISLMVAGILAWKWSREEKDNEMEEFTSLHISSVRRTHGVIGHGVPGPKPTRKQKQVSKKFAKGVEIVMINRDKGEFTMNDLMKASADVLTNGVLSSSYKAVMLNGMTVVVKRIKESAKIEKEQFNAEMIRLGRLRHANVLTPLAYHYRNDEKLLVFEYIPKGSLLCLLHGDRGPSHMELNWPTRLKIIQGIARGLVYLHGELSILDLPHGNLKSSNVLLTQVNEPLLTEYGLCSVINGSFAAQVLAAYNAPEAILDVEISPKCDVFCLGIVILEVLTGRLPAQFVTTGEGGVDAIQWVRAAIADGKEAGIFDPDIEQTDKSKGEMKKLLRIGVDCTETNPVQRLDMGEALRRIEDVTVERLG